MRRGASGLNLLLGIDKPAGMTSHDVVDRVRRVLGERRVGHAGTLDPLATGVMVVGVGQGTRLMGQLTADTKSYVARIAFGQQTNTDDAEGEVVRVADVPPQLADPAFARNTLAGFVGPQLQEPPVFSAISVGGERAYARARAGKAVSLAPRSIEVIAAELLDVDKSGDLCWDCAFTVSKGTYIRALARDIGRCAGSAAHLSALRRTASGTVTLGMCVTLEALSELGAGRVREVALDPITAVGIPCYEVRDTELARIAAGSSFVVGPPSGLADGRYAMVRDGALLGIWQHDGRRMRPSINFPQAVEGVRSC